MVSSLYPLLERVRLLQESKMKGFNLLGTLTGRICGQFPHESNGPHHMNYVPWRTTIHTSAFMGEYGQLNDGDCILQGTVLTPIPGHDLLAVELDSNHAVYLFKVSECEWSDSNSPREIVEAEVVEHDGC